MRRSPIILVGVLFLCTVATAQRSTPESGSVNNGVFRSTYFGFSYAYPEGWVIHGDATNQRMNELGKQRVKETKAIPDASAEVGFKHLHRLLTLFEKALGTPGVKYNRSIQIIAEDVKALPGITDGRAYLTNAIVPLKKMGCLFPQETPVGVVLAGRQFFRLDVDTPAAGILVHQAMIVTIAKGYALSFAFSVGPEQKLEDIVKTIDSLKFYEVRPHPPRRKSR